LSFQDTYKLGEDFDNDSVRQPFLWIVLLNMEIEIDSLGLQIYVRFQMRKGFRRNLIWALGTLSLCPLPIM